MSADETKISERLESIAESIEHATIRPTGGEECGSENVTDGLFAIADALGRCADALDRIGLGNASTPGALEGVAKAIAEQVSR